MTLTEQLNSLFKRVNSISIIAEADTVLLSNNRKSRFIKKDAVKLIDKLKSIEAPLNRIRFRSETPICSKSLAYFKELGLKVIEKK